MWNSSRPIKFVCYLQISQLINVEWSTCHRNNKSMYNCFYENKRFLVFSMKRETCQLGKKKQKMVKIYLLKLLLIDSWFSKGVHGKAFINWISGKSNEMFLKVDQMYSLLRKSLWKWLFVNRWKNRGMSKFLKVFTFNFSFICHLGRICK